MITTIAKREINGLFREKVFWILLTGLILLMGAALFTSSVSVKKVNNERVQAQEMSRDRWLAQPPKNPHSAAHFGNFAFRILSPLSFFDNGLNDYTGVYLFLEPHKQNGDKFSEAQESSSLLRFGELTPARVLHLLLPLLIIFTCFAAVSREKENETIKFLLTQGASMRQIVVGKIFGYWVLFLVLLLVYFAVAGIVLSALGNQPVQFGRFFLLFLIYVLYAGIWISLSVLVSAWSKGSSASLIKLLGIWIFAIVLLPKIAANIGSLLHKTPSQFEMAEGLKKDIEEGIDGHNPEAERKEELLKATLKEYGVDKTEDLPVNFDAVVMMEAEEYTTRVFRHRKARVDSIFALQNNISEWAAFINPAQALQYSSMALSHTDYAHYKDFQDQAEAYRLSFVNKLNEFMSTHTQAGDWDSKFGRELYTDIPAFSYHLPSLGFSLKHQPLALLAMLFWGLVCAVLVLFTNRIKIL